jgi:hypothetical protein
MAFPDGWNHYKEYSQPGTVDGEQLDYQVDIIVEHVTGKMRSDFGDIRFADEDENELYYHLVSFTESDEAHFIVKLPSLPTTGMTIRCYYGNSSATTTSNQDNVYEYYSSGQTDESADFTLVDIYNANVNASLTYDSINHYYKLKNTANDMIFAKINALDGKANLKLRADIYRYSNTNNDQGGLIGRKKASNTWVIGRYEVGVNKLDITQGLSGTYTEKDADSYTLAQSTWFTVELEIVGTVANLKWYNSSGTLVHSETTSSINAAIDTGDWGLAGGYDTNSERYFKNIIARKTTANPPGTGIWGEEQQIYYIKDISEFTHLVQVCNLFPVDDTRQQVVEEVSAGEPPMMIDVSEAYNIDDKLDLKISNFIIDTGDSYGNILLQYGFLITEKRRMMESYLRIKNSFVVPDERITEDLVVNTYVKSLEDIIYLADNVLVLETAVFQLIDIFDETDSIESLKLLVRLDLRDKREKTLTKQWRKDIELRINTFK